MAAFESPIKTTEAHFGNIKGTAKWAHVLSPNQFGTYSIDIYPDQDTMETHVALFEQMRDSAKEEVVAAGKKIRSLADVFKTDDEGKTYLQFKLPTEDKDGKAQVVPVHDVTGKKVPDWDQLIGNGSVVKVKYMAKPYYMNSTKAVGVSYKFFAVQVINLVEYTGGAGGGFDDESGNSEF
jgi:hypothetical protein